MEAGESQMVMVRTPSGRASTYSGAEHPAPGLPEQVEVVGDAEVLDHGGQLLDEQLHAPERRVGVRQVRAAPAAELVVVHDRAAAARGQPGHGQRVVVGRAGPAVQDDERRPGAPGEVAGHPVPGPVPAEGDLALGGGLGDGVHGTLHAVVGVVGETVENRTTDKVW